MFLGLFGILLVINIPNLLLTLSSLSLYLLSSLTLYDPKSNQTQVNVLCTATSSIIVLRNVAVIIFRIVLPLLLQMILSIRLIHKLFKTRKAVALVNLNRNMKKEQRFARIIVWLNVCFIITETPLMIATIYFGI